MRRGLLVLMVAMVGWALGVRLARRANRDRQAQQVHQAVQALRDQPDLVVRRELLARLGKTVFPDNPEMWVPPERPVPLDQWDPLEQLVHPDLPDHLEAWAHRDRPAMRDHLARRAEPGSTWRSSPSTNANP